MLQTIKSSCTAQGASQYPVINRNGKEYKQGYVSVCVTESLCSAAETNTTL